MTQTRTKPKLQVRQEDEALLKQGSQRATVARNKRDTLNQTKLGPTKHAMTKTDPTSDESASVQSTGPAKQKRTIRNATPESEAVILEVWKAYKVEPTESGRNQLMEYYLPLVRYNAERVHAKLPSEVDVDDLMSAGIFGLMDAINSFDLGREVKFSTYCAPRIRGAILDELRSMDWVPRLVRSRSSKVYAASRKIEARLGRKPTDEELREHLQVDEDEFAKIKRDGYAVGLVSLDRKFSNNDKDSDVREIDIIRDERQINPFRAVQREDLKDLIVKGLTRAEKLIVILYYYEEMTMKEIGMTLDLSESRVSQMHSSILGRLKAQLANRNEELEPEPN